MLRKFDEAENILRQDLNETYFWNGFRGIPKSFLLGELYLEAGKKEQARAAYAAALPSLKEMKEKAEPEGWTFLLAQAYAGMGQKAEALGASERAMENGAADLEGVAKAYATLGDAKDAVPILRHLLAVPSGVHREQLRVDPAWDPLRGDSSFQRLLQ